MEDQEQKNMSEPVACPKCGSTEMRYDPDLDDNAVICNKCEHDLGKLGDVKTAVRNNAFKQYAAATLKQKLTEAFKSDSNATFIPE
jgi:hypothetical protein